MRKLIEACPGCGGELLVTRLGCQTCDTQITGQFRPSAFDRLSPGSLAFAETFIRLRGNIREMERELGIPYGTVRGRLDDVISELGFSPSGEDDSEGEEGQAVPISTSDDRSEILERLDRGEITASEAADLLADLK